MKLYSIIKNIKCRNIGSTNLEISGLYHVDSQVKNNGLYFCIDGENFSGKNFVKNAVNNGAVAIVCEKEIEGLHCVTQIIVKNVRSAMSFMACNFYGNPAKKLKIIGVTGTNGKTTTTYMISSLINSAGKRCAIIGTNGVIYDNKNYQTEMTTPDPIVLQKIFKKMVKDKIEYVAMEVSAHAIYLDKLDGFKFELIIFTNLTEDHLDFFKTMNKYFEAKRKIFTGNHTARALINIDDEFGLKLYQSINLEKYTYSICKPSDYFAKDIKYKNYKQTFTFDGKKFETNFLGTFNIYNLLATMGAVKILNLDDGNLVNNVKEIKQVPGRFNTIEKNGRLFIVDYAHTPDGLENVLLLCKGIVNDKKLICVFGCGGNRETQKRSKMGEISSKFADLSIITSDNPRFESRERIALDIQKGFLNNNYKIILDRAEAVGFAYKKSNFGDVILVAGKGAENYIDEMGVKTKYSDFDVIDKLDK